MQVDGTEITLSSAEATGDFLDAGFGTLDGVTATLRFDDIYLITGSVSEYPLGAGRIDALRPEADGTHSFSTEGDFKYGSGTLEQADIPIGATDTHIYADELLNQESTFLDAELAAASEYLEWTLNTLPGTAASVRGVEMVSSWWSAGTAANKGTLRAVDGASTWDAPVDNDVSNTTRGYFSEHRDTKPSGGAWTQATVEGLKLRFASSFVAADVNPDVYFGGARLEVDWVEAPAGPANASYYTHYYYRMLVATGGP